MTTEKIILEKLTIKEQNLREQNLLKDETLNFNEVIIYLDISELHIYKHTNQKLFPLFYSQGKKIYFIIFEHDKRQHQNQKLIEFIYVLIQLIKWAYFLFETIERTL